MIKTIKILLILCFPFFCHATPPHDFYKAKKVAYLLFKNHQETLYCGCQYDSKKRINLASCHMFSARPIKRAHQMEWEHMMPAENFGKHFKCWREKLCVNKKGRAYRGRKCCKKINPEFRQAEGELYNLWPAVGLINQLRSHYRYAALNNRQLTFGCDFKADNVLRKVEPGERAKGIVARANLFMSDKYHINLSKSQRQLFKAWNKQFPANTWEKEWSHRVAMIEGYDNHYIK